ncbi:MAG: TRAP transporter small permease [Treponema sp.]|nr:TRAP transporter small permease [Treponema sp.]
MNIYKKLIDIIIKCISVLLVCTVGFIVLLMLNELIIRNVFNKSFRGMTELAGFLFLWMAFLGIPVLFYRKSLITLDIVSSRVTGKIKVIFWYIQQIVAFCLGIVMVVAFINLYPFVVTEYYSSMPTFSKMWQFLPLGIGGFFMSLEALYNILAKIMGVPEAV